MEKKLKQQVQRLGFEFRWLAVDPQLPFQFVEFAFSEAPVSSCRSRTGRGNAFDGHGLAHLRILKNCVRTLRALLAHGVDIHGGIGELRYGYCAIADAGSAGGN
jgi:hypothetical protein